MDTPDVLTDSPDTGVTSDDAAADIAVTIQQVEPQTTQGGGRAEWKRGSFRPTAFCVLVLALSAPLYSDSYAPS